MRGGLAAVKRGRHAARNKSTVPPTLRRGPRSHHMSGRSPAWSNVQRVSNIPGHHGQHDGHVGARALAADHRGPRGHVQVGEHAAQAGVAILERPGKRVRRCPANTSMPASMSHTGRLISRRVRPIEGCSAGAVMRLPRRAAARPRPPGRSRRAAPAAPGRRSRRRR